MTTQEGRTLRTMWDERVAESAASTFVISGADRWTYDEFDLWINRLAHGLASEGVGEGDVVAILLPSSVELLRVELAIQKLGAVMVPMIAGATVGEIDHVITDSGARYLVCDPSAWASILTSPGLAGRITHHYVVGEESYSGLDGGVEDPLPELSITAAAPSAIMYTSGTTAKPKGVVQPQAGFVSAGSAIACRLNGTAMDNWLCALPLFHTGCFHMVLAPVIATGARMTMFDRFEPDRFWDVSRDAGVTVALLVPTMLSLIEALPPSPRDRDHDYRVIASHIRSASFADRFGIDITTVWAMTETCGLGLLTSPGYDDYEPQLIGWPFPEDAEVQVVDPLGEAVAAGTSGELCFRHPHVMLEYHNDPTNTAKTLIDGWVRTGDLCRMDDRGRVFFEGRLKNVIKRSGENISGEEVEFAIMSHPDVVDCMVVPVDDPVRVQEVHATVVRAPGSTLSPEGVVAWAGAHLSRWKVPRYVQVINQPLPRLANGKINRSAVLATVDPTTSWDGKPMKENPDA